MNRKYRKTVIAGNWKMNKTPAEAKALIEEIKPLVKDATCDVIVGVPFVDLHVALEATAGTNIGVAAQNCHWAKSGAFTGEISADMLVACGVEYVIIGHSERRQYFGETDLTVNQRVKAALEAGKATADMSAEEICNIMVAEMTKLSFNGLTGTNMTWGANGEVSKMPTAVVITDGVYVTA